MPVCPQSAHSLTALWGYVRADSLAGLQTPEQGTLETSTFAQVRGASFCILYCLTPHPASRKIPEVQSQLLVWSASLSGPSPSSRALLRHAAPFLWSFLWFCPAGRSHLCQLPSVWGVVWLADGPNWCPSAFSALCLTPQASWKEPYLIYLW